MTEKLRILLRDNARRFWTDEQLGEFLAGNEGENRLWLSVKDAVTELLARDPVPEMSQEHVAKYYLLGANPVRRYGERVGPTCE